MNRDHYNSYGVRLLISKILIGYDGTDCSDRAVDFGLELAQKYSASVLIINVLEMPVYTNPEEPLAVSAGMSGLAKDLREAHKATLAEASAKAAKDWPNVTVTTKLLEGNPSAQIVEESSEGNFDVVIVGHGSQSRLQELFLGGTSERVAHRSLCTVIIVK
jgi:nucleotide-binding universal stress UspA family protein